MAFVRLKKIKGKEYAYLVENIWKDKRSQQRVLKYLGAVSPLGSTPELQSELLDEFQASIDFLIKETLLSAGFLAEGPILWKDAHHVDSSARTITKSRRPAVLGMNEGFLCDETWIQLRDFVIRDKGAGEELAKRVLEAGLRLSHAMFVQLYELAPKSDATIL